MKVFLVHGTGDTDTTASGTRWWQEEGKFFLLARASGMTPVPFIWSGKNNQADREKAAKELYRLIKREIETGFEIAIVAHSHGGNVARSACAQLSPSSKKRVCIFAVGTPFLKVRPVLFPRIPIWASLPYSLCALLILIALVFEALAAFPRNAYQSPLTGYGVAALFIPSGIISLLHVRRYLKFLRRDRLDAKDDFAIIQIRHPNDEAIAALGFTFGFRPSISRASISNQIYRSFSSNVLVSAIAIAIIISLSTSIQHLMSVSSKDFLLYTMLEIPVMAMKAVLIMFIMITVLSVCVPIVYLLSFFVSFLMRPAVNGFARGALQNSVFGLGGEYSIISVDTSPSTSCIDLVIGQAAEREIDSMVRSSSSETIEKFRRTLSEEMGETDAYVDLLSWRQLVHTSYFRSDACVQSILNAVLIFKRSKQA